MNYKFVLLILAQITLSLQLQLPFHIGGSLPEASHSVHYSSIDTKDHPIDLTQYKNTYVVRIDYSKNGELEKYLKSKPSNESCDSINFKRWGKNIAQKTIDIQIDDEKYG